MEEYLSPLTIIISGFLPCILINLDSQSGCVPSQLYLFRNNTSVHKQRNHRWPVDNKIIFPFSLGTCAFYLSSFLVSYHLTKNEFKDFFLMNLTRTQSTKVHWNLHSILLLAIEFPGKLLETSVFGNQHGVFTGPHVAEAPGAPLLTVCLLSSGFTLHSKDAPASPNYVWNWVASRGNIPSAIVSSCRRAFLLPVRFQ